MTKALRINWNTIDKNSVLYNYLAAIFYDDGTGEFDMEDAKIFVHEVVKHLRRHGCSNDTQDIENIVPMLEDPESHRVPVHTLVSLLLSV
ncbi:hypothetical protein THRCLA_23229 [Thraustotheca clavata]|uniref:Uncharacterized protein n=1 Tax=Thraustotheca clavata TaxID=74557 RepID=A0A1V9Y8Z5_9STRA|nr:hypothetical protein THRCLA_23229 [Thraustotheca clavata]